MQPLVSVIVPVYNVEAYLPQCIDSIIHQKYRNIDIILVDDGSTDHCGEICDQYAAKDSRIRVFHTKNGGLSAARNFGLTQAKGVYIGFIDSDDWIEPNMFEVLVGLAEEKKAQIICYGHYLDYPQQRLAVRPLDKTYDNPVDLCKALIHGDIAPGAVYKFYHKSCFSDIVFPEGHVFEEIATVYKLFLKVTSAVSYSIPLYHYRKGRNDSITQTRTMDNLVDYWIAHKSRYDYFLQDSRFNTDKAFMDDLLISCAYAIARTWRWCYANTEQEFKEYAGYLKEMQDFCHQNFPAAGMPNWPLHLRFVIFIGRFNHKLGFAVLYYVLQAFKLIRSDI